MTLSGFCGVDGDGGDFCAQTTNALHGKLTTAPGQKIRLRLSRRAGSVKADIVRARQADGEIQEQYPGIIEAHRVVGAHGRRWTFHTPHELYDANAIVVLVGFEHFVPYRGFRLASASFTSPFELLVTWPASLADRALRGESAPAA